MEGLLVAIIPHPEYRIPELRKITHITVAHYIFWIHLLLFRIPLSIIMMQNMVVLYMERIRHSVL